MRLPSALLLVDSDDSVARAARGLCLVSEWHGRDIFVPNPNRTHVCVPPPFSGAPGAGGPVEWGGGGCAGGGARRLASRLGGGRNFRFFNFRVRCPRNSIRGQTIMAKQTAPREAAVSPSSGRFQVVCGGGTGRPGAVSDPVYTGRCVAVRANTARGCPQAPLTAEKPPSYSPAAHRRPTHSRHSAYFTKLRGSRLHHSKTNELPARRSAAELSGGVRSRPGGPRLDAP